MSAMRNTAAVLFFVIAMLASTAAVGCSDIASASDPGGTPVVLQNPKIPQYAPISPGALVISPTEGEAFPASSVVSVAAKSTQPSTPHLRFQDEKQFMLGLINEERREAGVPEVFLGDSNAAQIHAENSMRDCISSHWSMDGLWPRDEVFTG